MTVKHFWDGLACRAALAGRARLSGTHCDAMQRASLSCIDLLGTRCTLGLPLR